MKITTLSIAVSALALALSSAHAQQKPLTVAWYGGNWSDAYQACVGTPFTEATGIPLVVDVGTSTTTLAKLQQQTDKPTIDVAFMDGGISELAEETGVVAPIDLALVPNASGLNETGIYRNGDKVFAVSIGYFSLGITYNTDKVSEAPTSWEALWQKEYAGAVTVPSPSNSAGVPFIFFLNEINGGKPDDMTATFKKLAALDVALFFDSSGAATNAFQSGEVTMGAHFNVGAWDLIDSGLPIAFVVPKEGVWASDSRLHIVKNAPNPDAAVKFINTAVSAEAAKCLAEKLYVGPAVKNVELAPETRRKLPWGENGSINDLRLANWNEVNKRRAELIEVWNREVAR